jgi:hypothetical protein
MSTDRVVGSPALAQGVDVRMRVPAGGMLCDPVLALHGSVTRFPNASVLCNAVCGLRLSVPVHCFATLILYQSGEFCISAMLRTLCGLCVEMCRS